MPSFLETPSASDMQQAHVPDEDAGSVPDEDAGTLATSSAALPNRAAAFSLLDLPNELLFPILDGLDYRALNALRSTCKTLRQILLLPRFDHALFRSGYEDHRDYALGNVIFEHQKRDRFSGLVIQAFFPLSQQIFDRPVHWSKATNLGSNITPCVSTVDTGFDVVVLDAGCQIEAYHLRDLVSFKPGSADAIRQVRSIAAAYPDDFPIILQWTGGRTGGHHSAEDFHQPILATYSRIRRNTNISLVTGIGFRSADDLWP
ncbi:unnamed protein product [Tilletia caries]|uniref:F-box domain-containing protein n=1 Tax=Tilletia caries TaxID=13290 RepID=A0ABN7J933_9BASI|nr:unnamed protein product [Tilletia caries]